MNARVPGYTGFIPSSRAEDVCARTQAAVGRSAQAEQMRRREMRALSKGAAEDGVKKRTLGFEGTSMPDDHPLGRSRSAITRNHWVPTIPGYGGFIPAKEAESCIGGGMTSTCRMAGRAIAERAQMQLIGEEPPAVPASALHHDPDLGRDESGVTPARERLVYHLRNHCEGKIPGYSGFIPRVHGESMFGANTTAINRLAADYCEDLAYNPSDHGKKCCAPQLPDARKLRM